MKIRIDNETSVGIYTLLAVTLFGSVTGMLVFRNESISWHITTGILTLVSLILIAVVFRFIDKLLDLYFPFEENVFRRFFIQLFASVLALGIFRYITFLAIGDIVLKKLRLGKLPMELLAVAVVVNALICAVYILSIMGYRFIQRWKESTLRATELEKEKAIVQFENLKNQLNPHFLFNTLSSLNSLISENPKLASEFLQQLSKVYRYLLENNEKSTVTLSNELSFIENYISLLTTRFGDGLKINIQVSEQSKEKMLTPVTLQVLIENAIKHNVTSSKQPLNIDIRTENDYLLVENNLQRKSIISHSHQKGLNQLKVLYSYITETPIEIVESPDLFTVKIPLLS